MGALKGHIDGIMGTSTARFFQPYSNDAKNRGLSKNLLKVAPKELLTTDVLFTIVDGKVVYQKL